VLLIKLSYNSVIFLVLLSIRAYASSLALLICAAIIFIMVTTMAITAEIALAWDIIADKSIPFEPDADFNFSNTVVIELFNLSNIEKAFFTPSTNFPIAVSVNPKSPISSSNTDIIPFTDSLIPSISFFAPSTSSRSFNAVISFKYASVASFVVNPITCNDCIIRSICLSSSDIASPSSLNTLCKSTSFSALISIFKLLRALIALSLTFNNSVSPILSISASASLI